MKKSEKILSILKWIYLGLGALFIIGSIALPLVRKQWLFIVILCILALFLIIYLTIHIINVKVYEYVCPKCVEGFKISLVKDITTFNAAPGAKILICPKCGLKEVMKKRIK